MSKPDNAGRNQDGTFPPGTSGNPAGRPKGCRSKVARMLDDAATEDDRRAVFQKILQQAKDGDTTSARLLLERWWPVPKGRAVEIDLPPLKDGADGMTQVLGAIVKAAAAGELTPDEARDLATVIEQQRKAIEVSEIIPKLRELETAARGKRK